MLREIGCREEPETPRRTQDRQILMNLARLTGPTK